MLIIYLTESSDKIIDSGVITEIHVTEKTQSHMAEASAAAGFNEGRADKENTLINNGVCASFTHLALWFCSVAGGSELMK